MIELVLICYAMSCLIATIKQLIVAIKQLRQV